MKSLRTSITIGTLLLSTVLLNACTPWGCEEGEGPSTRRTLTLDTFHGVNVQGSLDVIVTKGDVQHVEVEGQANLIDLLRTDVKDGKWTITTNKCYSTDKPFVVHITVPVMDHVVLQGSGSVKGRSEFSVGTAELEVQGSGDIELALVAGQIDASVQGSGDIRLTGSVGKLKASVEGSGDIHAGELMAGDVEADVMGSGDIKVQASGLLDAEITGSGDIKFRGTPAKLDQRITGSGDIKQVD